MEYQKQKKKWSKHQEKEFLHLLHLEKAFPDWEKISKSLKILKINKTASQCYYRWLNNKSKKSSYKIKYDKKETKFTKEEERKLLKLSFAYAPKWKKISTHFEGRNRFDITNHFYGIIKKTLIKACKILKIKNSGDIISKIKPRLYSSMINKEIKIDFREFDLKEKCFENENHPEFYFLTFYEFICSIYFYEFEDIWEKITEKEIFIIKKVMIYLIEINFSYNKVVKMSQRKIKYFSNIKDYLKNFQNKIIFTLNKSFYEENKTIIELPEETIKRKQESKIIEQKNKIRREKQKLLRKQHEIKNNVNNFNYFKNELIKSELTQNELDENFFIEKNYQNIHNQKNIYHNIISLFNKFNKEIQNFNGNQIYMRKNKKNYVIGGNLIYIKKKKKDFGISKNYSFFYKTRRKSVVATFFEKGFNISYYGKKKNFSSKKKTCEDFKGYYYRNERIN